jgi:hypothetical protein
MSANDFASVRVVGGLLPPDLLARIISGDPSLGGLTGSDYHLSSGESPREAANRAWSYLLGAWTTYKQALDKLPDGDPAVGLTRERWLTLLFRELDYGRLQQTPPGGLVIDDKSFPVSHLWGATPMHLLGWGVDLDKRTKGVAGAAERAPQAMVQEALNRTNDHLWAILANGKTVRLLRDSTSLTGQAYVEFDLETMFDGELFSDFALLYLLLHQSRVEVPTDGSPADCWLETWRTSAAESGTRALGLLRDGVKEAIEALGTGFLQAPGNDLNSRLADGSLRIDDYHRSLLRLVYRLLFLFVAEDRGLLIDPGAGATQRERYQRYFSTSRLRSLSRKRRGSRHTDLWQALELVMTALGKEGGRPELGLIGLGGIFNHEPIDVVTGQQLPNQALLTAVRKLSVVHPKGSPSRIVDYRNLGAEELGSIYESLLELVPRHDKTEWTFTLELLAGNDRKTSGSYYTPSNLIDLVLDEALEPILDEREKANDPEQALLTLTVCDPACGSGHFLVGAARRIATRLATARTGEADPTPAEVQAALHDVVAKCIYGVDLNPMAAELAKVSLWLEAMQPGRPLSFLDAHIKVGNALLGTTPRLLADGIPDAAFDPLEGDDRKYASALKKRNKAERDKRTAGEQGDLFGSDVLDTSNAHLRAAFQQVLAGALRTASLAEVHELESRYRLAQDSPEGRAARLRADTWCAAFVQQQVAGVPAVTQAALEELSPEVEAEVRRLAASFRFFHWHLEFPEVFDATGQPQEQFKTSTGWSGGFTVMVGNPPWERVKLQEQEFFARLSPEIASAPTAASRKLLIKQLLRADSDVASAYAVAARRAEAESLCFRATGRFPLTGRGDVNTYSLFAELITQLCHVEGRGAFVTPTGLATDATTAPFFSNLLKTGRLLSFSDFENRNLLFEGVYYRFRFAVTCVAGGATTHSTVRLAFMLHHPNHLRNQEFEMSVQEILRLNPNTGTLAAFASRKDAELAIRIYGDHPVLVDDTQKMNGWQVAFWTMFHMANDSDLFHTASALEDIGARFDGFQWVDDSRVWTPLIEAKMLSLFDHRAADVVKSKTAMQRQNQPKYLTDREKESPTREAVGLYWLADQEVQARCRGRAEQGWLLGWSEVTSTTNWRTMLPTLIPSAAVGNKFQLCRTHNAYDAVLLLGIWSSFCFDYLARQKLSGLGLNQFILKQLPCPRRETLLERAPWSCESSWAEEISVRVAELSATSWSMVPLLRDLEMDARPFKWEVSRRTFIAAELDAIVFHIYGLSRDDVVHVMDSFPIVRKYDERDSGEFLTQRLILECYDAMAEASSSGIPYGTPIDPPPGFGPRHDPSTRPAWLKETS